MQHAILLERSLDAAAWIAKRFNEKYPSFQFKAEDVRCIAMALQIPAERAGFAGLMPTQLPKDK
jgi:hypothetical protein